MWRRFQRFIHAGGKRGTRVKINILVALILKGGSALISFIMVPLTLSYLTKYEYGIWLTLNSVLMWINYFDIGLSNGLRNKLAETIALNDWEKGRFYVSTTFFLLVSIVLVIIILFVFINDFLDWNAILNIKDHPINNMGEIVLMVFSLCCANFVMKTIGVIYVANQQPMINDILNFLGQLFSLVFIYLLTVFTKGNLLYVAVCYSITPLLVYLLAYPYTFGVKYKCLAPSFKAIDLKYAKVLGGMGMQFFILQMVCLVLFSTSNLIITQLYGPEEVTPYNIAFRYMSVSTMLFTIIISPLWSAITDAFTKKEYIWIKKSIDMMTKFWFLFILFVLFMVAVSQVIFEYWVGDSIHISYSLLCVLALYACVDAWNKIYASFANGTGHLKVQMYSAIVEGVLFFPLAYFFSKAIGVIGVPLSLTIVFFIPGIILWIDYKKTLNSLLMK